MNVILLWSLVIYWVMSAVLTVLLVGKQRKPIDSSTAALSVIISALFIAALFVWGGVR